MKSDQDFQLPDLVPLETLETLRRLFKAVVGVPMVFVGADGMAVTQIEDPLRYCGSLVRCADRETYCLRRKKWDEPEDGIERNLLAQHAGPKPLAHRCLGGFRDTAVPIVVEEQVVGYSVFARSLPEPPDVQGFRDLALQAGMDPDVGQQVAEQAVVMEPEQIKQVAEFLQVITELVARAAYDTLRARRVLELEELRDSLVHMIVHDLRTPLTSILGGLQTVVDTEYDADLTREFVPMSLNSAQTLLEMVNTLLDINKMESGEMQLELEPVSISDIGHTAIDQVRGLATERRQELSISIDETCPMLEVDGEKLRRLTVNLLGNAIKFTQDGGHIHLSAECADGGVTIAVADNGPGIPAEDHDRVFQKFGQVQARKAGRKNSTGLGLTFCKMVAEAHHGRIWLESELGKGTTFYVWLPQEPPQA